MPGLVKGNTYLTAQQQVEQLAQPVNQAIIDTAQFLKEQGKVPQVAADYSHFNHRLSKRDSEQGATGCAQWRQKQCGRDIQRSEPCAVTSR